ncbi:hypothetical protein [Niveispirillum fermenti]|uniref:hypothetical protein n=1 Tax=Niveispirillum fermenti TaxID=1233113 RepID=UPI003A86FAA1
MTHLIRGPRALLSAVLFIFACGLAPVPALAAFVPGTEDVPLAPGLVAAPDDALVFDNPTGRIVQSTATGQAGIDAVTRFYAETLPQLGWTRGADGRWTRQAEVLDIAIQPQGGRLTVRFQLSPRDPAP